jgi:superfamily II DNA or RNA helicase
MPCNPRPYQDEIIEGAVNHLKTSSDPAVLDMCVGAGKIIVISHIARHVTEKGGKVIALAHRKELVKGAYKTFRQYAPDLEAGIFSAAIGRKYTQHQITFCSERSLVNSLHLFEKIGLLIIDEAHRVNDQNDKTCYIRIIAHFAALNPKLAFWA